MKRILFQTWLTAMCFLLLGDVHAWEVPNYLRINAGTRMWFSAIQGDLIQRDRVKLDLINNVGLNQNKLIWEFFGSLRYANVHVFRLRIEPQTVYDSKGDSYFQTRDFRLGYDLDFYMSPQILFGANLDLEILNNETKVSNVVVGNTVYDYSDSQTRTIPLIGLHGTYYPILDNVALRPNVSARVNWWNYESLETWDWEVASAVDVPINRLWTWTVNGGYRFWHTKTKRDRDTVDINRTGFFVESSLLF